MDDNTRNIIYAVITAFSLLVLIRVCLSYNNEYQAMKMGYEQTIESRTGRIIWTKKSKETKVVEEQNATN